VYVIKWDPDDSRFGCYDGTIWESNKDAIAIIYEWCEKHKNDLQITMNNDGFEGSFEAWIAWCIKNFCNLEPQTVYGHFNRPIDDN
jgi:hypothetical protein